MSWMIANEERFDNDLINKHVKELYQVFLLEKKTTPKLGYFDFVNRVIINGLTILESREIYFKLQQLINFNPNEN